MGIKEQMKEIMDASVTCDKCNHEFVIKEESIMKEKMEVKGLKFDLIYFYCPSCKKIYRASIQDRKYYLLVEELDKARKQVRDNFGTFDTTKANKLNKKLKKKILMPMTFNSFQQKKLLKMVLLISNQVSRW